MRRIHRRGSRARRRRGITVIELAAAVLLLGVAMSVTAQLLGAIAYERRAVGRREVAAREVANLMEHLTARPWERLTPDAVKEVRLSEPTANVLPGAELTVTVDEAAAAPEVPGKRVAIRLRWHNRAGEFDAPVRLTTWVYRHDGGRAPR